MHSLPATRVYLCVCVVCVCACVCVWLYGSSQGRTALLYALSSGFRHTSQLLVRRGSDVFAYDKEWVRLSHPPPTAVALCSRRLYVSMLPVPLHRAGRLYTGLRVVVTVCWCAHYVRLAATRSNAVWFVAVRCVFAVPASSTWLDMFAHILDNSHQRSLNAMQVALHHQKKGAAYELRQWYGTLCCPIPYHAGGWRSQLVGVCQVPPRTVSAGATRDRLRHAG